MGEVCVFEGKQIMCTKERKEYVYKELRDTIDDLILLDGIDVVESKLGVIILER